jgi:16S rRNA (cytidine1402-2'-O)-methyltransferase
MSFRAIEMLKHCDLILAEDTRKTGILLKHYQIEKALWSHHKFNEHNAVASVIERLREGKNIALVSDAGTPGISDPGFLLVRECIQNGIEVETLPGPVAFIPALVNSGLPCDRFCFEGFLPPKKGRNKRLEELKSEKRTMVFYESPYRLLKTLKNLSDHLGSDRKASVSRELTKIHEETIRGSLTQIHTYYSEKVIKGEIVIVVSGE